MVVQKASTLPHVEPFSCASVRLTDLGLDLNQLVSVSTQQREKLNKRAIKRFLLTKARRKRCTKSLNVLVLLHHQQADMELVVTLVRNDN